MRSLLLALALCVPSTTFAQEAPPPAEPAAQAAPAPRAAAPATVLSHEVVATVDGSGRMSTTVTWHLRIDDPEACAAGLVAPAGLDGASDGAVTVLDDTLILPLGTPAGAEIRLQATSKGRAQPGHSGSFLSAPDLPAEKVRFEIRAPGNKPLHLWHDPAGVPDIGSRGGRSVAIEWTDLPANRAAEAVWSTWEDWMSAGTEITAAVDDLMTDKSGLGREMAAGFTGLHLGEAAERVQAAIEVDPYGSLDWLEASPASETLSIGRGSPVDRGVVLLSLLRLASYDAEPGYFRPARARGSFPVTIPAPAMLGRPIIVVHTSDGDVWLDPASDHVRAPQTPADVIGGVTWLPGDLPAPHLAPATADGEIVINGSITVKGDGSATWSADLSAAGTAEQRLRELLGPLDEATRTNVLHDLVTVGRPDLGRFAATTTGIEKTRAKLKITLSGFDPVALAPIGAGLKGQVPALIAPALAGWLPPNIHVREVLSIQVPQAVEILSATAPPSAFDDAALIARTTEKKGARVALITEVERPYRIATNATELRAQEFLSSEANKGPVLLVHTAASKDTVALLRSTDIDEAERLVIEAALWWRQRIAGKANKALKLALTNHGAQATAMALEQHGAGERKLWSLLLHNAEKHSDAIDRLDALAGAARTGHVDLAWEAAGAIAADESIDAMHRGLATFWSIELQPAERPDLARDPAGHSRWADPAELLERAASLLGEDDPRIARTRAEKARDAGDWAAVLAAIARVAQPDPQLRALAVEARANTGVGAREVLAELDEVLADAPTDADVLAAAAGVATTLGEPRRATRYALTSARVDTANPERWDLVVKTAIAAGELPTAAVAARMASDLDSRDAARAEALALVSAMTHDEDGWTLARTRNPAALASVSSPRPDVNALMEIAPSEGLLGVLQFHDEAVVDDPILLGIRAQMRLDAGLLDEASRDGWLLASRYGQADGVALAFAASAGRTYSSSWDQRLDRASRDSISARSTRMEVALLVASSDPLTDARALAGDPRAAVIERLRTDAKGLAAEVEGWPVDAKRPALTVRGYKPNSQLGAAPGVAAVSDPETSTTVLRTVAVDALPPPLYQLFTPSPQVLAELPGGGTVVRLEGGPVPVFWASEPVTEGAESRLHGLGFSVEAASRALARARE